MSALKGIRVLDLGTFIAGPHCATILGEFGAEVIKVEPPKTGDSLRRLGTNTECGDTLVWLSEARNKKCVTLNLGTERGKELLRELGAEVEGPSAGRSCSASSPPSATSLSRTSAPARWRNGASAMTS